MAGDGLVCFACQKDIEGIAPAFISADAGPAEVLCADCLVASSGASALNPARTRLFARSTAQELLALPAFKVPCTAAACSNVAHAACIGLAAVDPSRSAFTVVSCRPVPNQGASGAGGFVGRGSGDGSSNAGAAVPCTAAACGTVAHAACNGLAAADPSRSALTCASCRPVTNQGASGAGGSNSRGSGSGDGGGSSSGEGRSSGNGGGGAGSSSGSTAAVSVFEDLLATQLGGLLGQEAVACLARAGISLHPKLLNSTAVSCDEPPEFKAALASEDNQLHGQHLVMALVMRRAPPPASTTDGGRGSSRNGSNGSSSDKEGSCGGTADSGQSGDTVVVLAQFVHHNCGASGTRAVLHLVLWDAQLRAALAAAAPSLLGERIGEVPLHSLCAQAFLSAAVLATAARAPVAKLMLSACPPEKVRSGSSRFRIPVRV